MPDSMIYFGDSLKALDENGKVGGYLVRFSDGKAKDLSGEYFVAETYLGAREGDGVDTIFHHGQPLPVKAKLTAAAQKEVEDLQDHLFAPVKTKRDAIGIFAETVLDMSDVYEKVVFGLVKANKLGWSSGAVGHLVKKDADGRINRWPIGEASITPQPCEPLNRAVTIKSFEALKFTSLTEGDDVIVNGVTGCSACNILFTKGQQNWNCGAHAAPLAQNSLAAKLNQHIDDLVDDKGRNRASITAKLAREAGLDASALTAILNGTDVPSLAKLKAFARVLEVSFDSLKAYARHDHLQTIKGMFEEALAEQTPTRWELESIYCKIIKRLANAASAAKMAGVTFDLEAKVAEATNEYTNLLQKHALGQIAEWMLEGADDDFYLKSIIDTAGSAKALAASDLDSHSQLTVSVLREIAARFRGNHDGRVKAGRVLSDKNRTRITDLMQQLMAVHANLEKLMDESKPMASDMQKRAAQTAFLRAKWRSNQLGVNANG